MMQKKVKALEDKIALIQGSHRSEMKRARHRLSAEKKHASVAARLASRRERVASLMAELAAAKCDLAKTEEDFRTAEDDLHNVEKLSSVIDDADALDAKPSCDSVNKPVSNESVGIGRVPDVKSGVFPPTTNAQISSVPILSNSPNSRNPKAGPSDDDTPEKDLHLAPAAFSPVPHHEGYISPLASFKA